MARCCCGISLPYANATVRISVIPMQAPTVGERLTFPLNITNGQNVAGHQATITTIPMPSEFIQPETWIPYQLAEPADVKVSIYTFNGRPVRTLALGGPV